MTRGMALLVVWYLHFVMQLEILDCIWNIQSLNMIFHVFLVAQVSLVIELCYMDNLKRLLCMHTLWVYPDISLALKLTKKCQ